MTATQTYDRIRARRLDLEGRTATPALTEALDMLLVAELDWRWRAAEEAGA